MKSKLLAAAVLLSACALAAEIPLPEHPRPDWERAEWMNLNGEWDFGFAAGKYDRKILVPFGWGSPLSGVKDEGDIGYYRRSVTVPAAWKGKRVFAVVGAADHTTECTFAGEALGMRLSTLSIDTGHTSRTAASAHSAHSSHRGAFLNTSRTSTTARIRMPVLAEENVDWRISLNISGLP